MAENLCPTCHSCISKEPIVFRRRGSETPGLDEQGNVNELPENIVSTTEDIVPLWSDDPILTRGIGPKDIPFNGDEFLGPTNVQLVHWLELQEVRRNEEIEVGLTEEERTDFSDIVNVLMLEIHVLELRKSVEKILNVVGTTLQDYFRTDAEGNRVEAGPNDDPDKEDWTDVLRGKNTREADGVVRSTFILPDGTEQLLPSVPNGTTASAVHIEDLRRPIQLGWQEFWSVSPEIVFNSDTDFNNAIGLTPLPLIDGEITFLSGGIREFFQENGTGFRLITDKNINPDISFPTGFEVSPSDAGNVYIEDGERLWIVKSQVQKRLIEHSNRQLNLLNNFVGTPGPCGKFTLFTETGKVVDAESTINLVTGPSTDSDVLDIRPTSRKLQILANHSSVHLPFITDQGNVSGVASWLLELTHNWKDNGQINLPSVSETFKDRTIKITDKTEFKFLMNINGTKTREFFEIEQTDVLDNLPGDDPIVIATNAIADGLGNFNATIKTSEETFDFLDAPGSSMRWRLTLREPETNNIVNIIINFEKQSSATFVEVTDPFGDDVFNIQRPSNFAFTGSPQNVDINILLFNASSIFDEAININSLLSAFRSMTTTTGQNVSDLFFYTPKQLEDSSILEFEELFIRATGGAVSSLTTFVDNIGDSPDLDTAFGFAPLIRFCGETPLAFLGNKKWNNDQGSYDITLEALRIENNSNKIGS